MTNAMTMAQADDPALRRPITAKLFSIDGRMDVHLSAFTPTDAVGCTDAPPEAGSIAVVARNGIRIVGTVAAAGPGDFRLSFERPIEQREQAMFVGDTKAKRASFRHDDAVIAG